MGFITSKNLSVLSSSNLKSLKTGFAPDGSRSIDFELVEGTSTRFSDELEADIEVSMWSTLAIFLSGSLTVLFASSASISDTS